MNVVMNSFLIRAQSSTRFFYLYAVLAGLIVVADLIGWRIAAARGVWAATGFVFLALISWVDWRQRVIPGRLLLTGAVLILALRLILEPETVPGTVMGGAAGLAIFAILARLADGQLGGGDVWLAGFIGLVTGVVWVAPALLLGMLLGGLIAFVLTISGRAQMDDGFPYGPALSLGTFVIMFWELCNC